MQQPTHSPSSFRNPLQEVNEVLSMRFSYCGSYFIFGLSHGFSIHESQPYKCVMHRHYFDGNFEVVDLFELGTYALVGNGRNDQFPNNKVAFWENNVAKELSFPSPVLNIRMNAELIIIASSLSVYLYRIKDLAFVDQLSTYGNPTGLITISNSAGSSRMAFPGDKIGYISTISHEKNNQDKQAITIIGHNSQLVHLNLNHEGTILVSADKLDRYILVWDSYTGTKLFRFRKEGDVGIICSTAFSEGDFYLATTYSVGATFIYTIDNKADYADNSVDREENCVDALAFRFFDSLFCGLVGATLPSDEAEDTESSFARLYPSSLSGNPQLQQPHGGGRSETIFSSESEQRLLQLSYQSSLLIRYDFQDGGDIFAADQPPLTDGEPIFTQVVMPAEQQQQEIRGKG